jgi:hypothetical protein
MHKDLTGLGDLEGLVEGLVLIVANQTLDSFFRRPAFVAPRQIWRCRQTKPSGRAVPFLRMKVTAYLILG